MNERVFIDQLGSSVFLEGIPQRIVSLVPSQTELLYGLGLDERVVGITKFCVHPKHWHQTKARIGGTKTINVEAVLALSPDLVIANKEENTKEAIELIQKHCPVWVSDVKDLKSAREMIAALGEVLDTKQVAKELCSSIIDNFSNFQQNNLNQKNALKGKRAAYFIWRNPWMTVGNDTFIHSMLESIGLVNVFEKDTRYPTTTLEALEAVQIDFVLLSSEPFPFKEKHIKEIQAFLPHSQILLVDGEYFSWYGSRLQGAPQYFQQLFSLNQ